MDSYSFRLKGFIPLELMLRICCVTLIIALNREAIRISVIGGIYGVLGR